MKFFLQSVSDSFALLAFKTSKLSLRIKIAICVAISVVIGALMMVNGTNALIRLVSASRNGERDALAGIPESEKERIHSLIDGFFVYYLSGDLNTLYLPIILTLIGPIILGFVSRYLIHGVVSNAEMAIVKTNDNYRFGDSVIFQYLSSFSFLQLITLVTIGRLVTFDAPHGSYAIAAYLGMWSLSVFLTVTMYWGIEYFQRRLDARTRRKIFIPAAIIVITAGWLLRDHLRTLFGLTGALQNFTNRLASGDIAFFWTTTATLLVAHILVAVFVSRLAQHTLLLPERTFVKTPERNRQPRKPLIPFGTQISPTRFVWTVFVRYNILLRPVVTTVITVGLLTAFIQGAQAISTATIIIPLSIGLSLGANFFGVFGYSSNWLLSLPSWRIKIFNTGVLFVAGSTLIADTIVILLGLLTRSYDIATVLPFIPHILASTIASTLVCMWLSLTRPLPFSGKTKENLVSSPTAIIEYSLLLMFTLVGINTVMNSVTGWYSWAVVGALTLVAAVSYVYGLKRWVLGDKLVQNMLEKTVNIG